MDDNFILTNVDTDKEKFKFDSTNEELKSIRLGGVFDTEKSKHQAGSVWDKEGLSPTLDTMQGGWRQPCVVEEPDDKLKFIGGIGNKDIAGDGKTGLYAVNELEHMKIRKLTPRECWRLMGFDDSDFDKVDGKLSNTQLYKQAGNSIVVNVLEAIYKELFKAIKF